MIDIDDEQMLFDIKNRGLEAETETDKVILNALYNGKPLPKGHGRLIDADRLREEMVKDVRRAMSFVDLIDFVWLAPTIIKAGRSEEG